MTHLDAADPVMILDSTLREGEQTAGVCFPLHAKLAIAGMLERVGVSIVEAGHPIVSTKIETAVRRLARQSRSVMIAAHARSLETDIDVALRCNVQFLGIFYCVANERLKHVHRMDFHAALDRITAVIRYARQRRPELTIRFTPEDTVRSDWHRVVEAAAAAVDAGADVISIADTTGYMVPQRRSMYDFVSRLRDALARRNRYPVLAAHCHNDRGLALANVLDAHRGGARILDASVLGLGERAGIVDLAQLLTVLSIDYGMGRWNLEALPDLYETVARYSGLDIPPLLPVSGANAFTHCAGIHTHAATRNAVHYQSIDPALFGRSMKVALDHMSGMASVRYALARIGCDPDDTELASAVLARVKQVGETGRSVGLDELRDIVGVCSCA